MGALLRGLAAGAAGAAVQSLFFVATKKLAPSSPEGIFQPPEHEQKSETATQTVARRFTEDFLQRGPLSPEQKSTHAQLVHYGFGAAWGGLYGLARETWPIARGPLASIGMGTIVWAIGDNLVLPAFKLAAWPQHYPAKVHGYAFFAHVAYGLGTWAAYELARPRSIAFAGAALWAIRKDFRYAERLPRSLRPAARSLIGAIARSKAASPEARLENAPS